MRVQTFNYLYSIGEYKTPLFIHGIGSCIKDVLNGIRNNVKGNFLSFLKRFNVSPRMFYYYENDRKSVPATLLVKLLEEYRMITNKNIDRLLNKIFLSFFGVSSRGNARVKLPRSYSKNLAYLTGFVIGDGYISKRNELIVWEETKIHAKHIAKSFNNLFHYEPSITKESNYYIVTVSSAPIHFFSQKS